MDSPYEVNLGEIATDIPEMLFADNLPEDNVGFMPSNEKKRSKR